MLCLPYAGFLDNMGWPWASAVLVLVFNGFSNVLQDKCISLVISLFVWLLQVTSPTTIFKLLHNFSQILKHTVTKKCSVLIVVTQQKQQQLWRHTCMRPTVRLKKGSVLQYVSCTSHKMTTALKAMEQHILCCTKLYCIVVDSWWWQIWEGWRSRLCTVQFWTVLYCAKF